MAKKLTIKGLKGGHSGVDIVLQRGNANKLMVRLLKALNTLDMRLLSFEGGNLRNAIPREAFAEIAVPADKVVSAERILKECLATFQGELAEVEPDMSVTMSDCEIMRMAMNVQNCQQLLDVLQVSPNGVHRMSLSVEGIVETSNNLAVVKVKDGQIAIENMVRSLIDSAREDHAETIASLYRLIGAEVVKQGHYPGWKPNMESEILKIMKDLHVELFDEEAVIKVIHAGLECGLLGSVYPKWDMISFGPTIRFPHSPDEKVHIPAVENFWNYLLKILSRIPKV